MGSKNGLKEILRACLAEGACDTHNLHAGLCLEDALCIAEIAVVVSLFDWLVDPVEEACHRVNEKVEGCKKHEDEASVAAHADEKEGKHKSIADECCYVKALDSPRYNERLLCRERLCDKAEPPEDENGDDRWDKLHSEECRKDRRNEQENLVWRVDIALVVFLIEQMRWVMV